MAALFSYRAFGLNVDSTFEIFGGIRVEKPEPDADIIITAGDTSLSDAEVVNGPYSRNRGALLFDAAGVARYYAPSPKQLFIEPYPSANPRNVGELLIATALPMLMWMRGGIVLHAAGIVPAGMDKAIAITGPSGIGKSTLAAGMIAGGGRLVGDDSLWLTMHSGAPIVSGLSASLFRTEGPATQKCESAIPSQRRVENAGLAAIIVLHISDRDAIPLPRRLQGADALEALLKNRHRPKIPAILGLEAALLPQCILHCRTLPIYEFTMRKGDVAGSQQKIASIFS